MDEREVGGARVSRARAERNVESLVLALVITHHPRVLTIADVIGELSLDPNPPERREAIERAVVELVRVDLLRWVGARIEATPAGLRAGELELGL